MNNAKLETVQVLRAVAALAVLVTHVGMIERQYLSGLDQSGPFVANANTVDYNLIFGNFGWIGTTGVDLFFVISGFIMVHVSQATKPGILNFIKYLFNRGSRIFPMYWMATLLMLVLGLLGLIQFRYSPPFGDLLRHMLLFPSGGWPFLDVGWSLIFELYFYAVFGVGYFLFSTRIWVFLMLWAIAVTCAHLVLPSPNRWYIGVLTSPFSLHFIFGAFVALVQHKLRADYAWLVFGLSVSVLFVLCIILFFDPSFASYHTMIRSLSFGLVYAVLLLSFVCLENNNKVSMSKGWVQVGDASYSLYLTHVPILSFVAFAWYRVAGGYFGQEALRAAYWDNILVGLCAAAFAIYFSLMVGKFVEKPLVKGGKKVGAMIFR